jgi:hypothetical protein
MNPMKPIGKFLSALSAPFYAMSGASRDYRAEEYHVGVWFLIAIILTFATMVSGWMGWPWAQSTRLPEVAFFATLVCRLALVEREVKELRQASSSDSSHT